MALKKINTCLGETCLLQVAVVNIFNCAKTVNIPAEILRSATKERMFMAPYISARINILAERRSRYESFGPAFSPLSREPPTLYAE